MTQVDDKTMREKQAKKKLTLDTAGNHSLGTRGGYMTI